MNKIAHVVLIALMATSFVGCASITPGVPGLKTSASRYAKPQREGVDYKLVVINADTIRKQKPFDYAAYIRSKKKRTSIYEVSPNSQKQSNNAGIAAGTYKKTQPSRKSSASANNRQYSNATRNEPVNKTVAARFEGITAYDNKVNYQYYVGKGDVLNITVWDHPELTTPSENNGGHTVGSDGRFYFPYSGKINAVGKTIRSIRDELQTKLGSFITKPQVSVSIAKYRSQKIYTSGALNQPRTIVVNDTPTTVRDAISQSGGLRPNQYTGFATLARNGRNISIDLNRMLKYNDFNRKLNLEVRKENTLSSVRLRNEIRSLRTLNPMRLEFELEKERSIARLKKELERELRSEQAKVFVMGEVLKPGTVKYQVEDGMTLAEAINDSGSFKEESVNPKGIFVIRREAINDKVPTVYQLPIASVQSMFLAEQFNVRPRDIVYVTATPSIRWNRVIGQLLPSLAILNTFRNFK